MNKNQQALVAKVSNVIKKQLEGEGSGHDWWHVYRVWKMAQYISRKEHANFFVVELAALLHDIADWKFHEGDDTVGPKRAGDLLRKFTVSEDVIDQVCDIIATMAFKGANVKTDMKTIEGKIVQDADRLDAIGAIGIARTFAYGGYKNRLMYDPIKKPVMHKSKEQYFNNQSPTINHFYEKLLLLKDRMNTETAKKIAKERHEFMQTFLKQFLKEWTEKS